MSLLDTASLIVTPNGYKDGKLYSVIPSDGSGDLSVTRATTATRVNSQGLVELVPYNLVSYSEQFDNAAYIKVNATITSNAITAPDGTLTADKFESTAAAVSQLIQSITSSNTISIYAKAGNIDILNIWIGSTVTFNLTNGTVTAGTATMEDAGNGWWRCIITTTYNSFNPFIIASASGQFVYVWGAQANEGTIKPYQKTETRLNIPRLDYSNGTCPSILVEPQRTNLLTYSSSFDNGSWSAIDTTITANTTASPNGNTDADTMAITSSTSRIFKYTALGSGTYTASIYVKSLSGTPTIQFRMVVDGTDITESIPTTTDWVRHDFTFTASSSMDYFVIRGESGTGSVAIYGAQLEVGSYATSYIPTTSASVTRNADVISKTGISSLIGQTEGTFLIDYYYNGQSTSTVPISIDGGGGNEVYILVLPYGAFICEMYVGGIQQFSISGTIGAIGRKKIALAYKLNDCALYMNGTQIGTNTSATIPLMDRIFIGNFYATDFYNINSGINASALWKQRLSNTQLAQLTTI